MLSSYCGQILSCLPVCSVLKVHLRFANTKGLNPLQVKSLLTSTGFYKDLLRRHKKKTRSENSSAFLKAIQLFHNPNLFNNRSKSYLILQNSPSLQYFKCRNKYQIVSLMINGTLNLDFDHSFCNYRPLLKTFAHLNSQKLSIRC